MNYMTNGVIRGHQPHSPLLCRGNCELHPLLKGPTTELFKAFHDGWGWGDHVYTEELEKLYNESPEEREIRLKKEADRAVLLGLDINSYIMKQYSERVAIRANRGIKKGQEIRKRIMPCRWVCGEHKGEDCWAWEYTDPRDGSRKKPRTCEYLHPNEIGWKEEWLEDGFKKT